MCVFVGMDFGQPRRSGKDTDAEFFFKLALQGLKIAFAGFHLAAGKFPIAGIRLALRAGTEQVAAVLVEQIPATTCTKGRVSSVIMRLFLYVAGSDTCRFMRKKTMSGLCARLLTNI